MSFVDQLRSFISHFSSVFALQYIGPINYFLRIEVQQCSTYLHISQQKYIHNLLTRTTMIEGKATLTPSALGKPLSFFDGEPLPDPSLYWSIVGALQYVTITRPDISFAVNNACQFMAHSTSTHWLSIKRILRYLEGASTHSLLLHSSSSLALQGYTDADWASCSDDRKNTSGSCLFLIPNLISWSFSKQEIVSWSNAKSEYKSLASLTTEIV